MKDKIKKFIIDRRYKQISDIKLKELFLKVNKKDVLNFCMEYLNKDKYYETIALIIGYDEKDINLCPINDREYLSRKYDYFFDLCKNNYSNELSKKYAISTAFGFPYGFGEFLSLLSIENNIDNTDIFSVIINEDSYSPIELFLDCRISKSTLKRYKDICVVGRFILQAVYIEEDNNILSKVI